MMPSQKPSPRMGYAFSLKQKISETMVSIAFYCVHLFRCRGVRTFFEYFQAHLAHPHQLLCAGIANGKGDRQKHKAKYNFY